MLVVCLAAAAAILLTASAQNIVRNACQTEATFYKIASGHAMVDAKSFIFESSAGITGCIDGCIENKTCHAFNTKKLQAGGAMCELLPTDRNTKPNDIVAKVGWNYYDTGLYASKVRLLFSVRSGGSLRWGISCRRKKPRKITGM